jgi:MHS family proline/betaine transporter-like MFS transporter
MHFQSWKQRIFIAFSSAFEYYDFAIYFALQTYIAHHFFPETALGTVAFIIAWSPFVVRYLAMPFGGIFIGYYAEKYGRRAGLILSSWITGAATLGMACLPTFDMIGYWAPMLLLLFQIMQSFSYGGELPTALVYLMESSQPNQRVRTCSILVAFNILIVSLCFMVTGLCELLLSKEQMWDFGWRIPILFGGFNLLVGYIIRLKFVETSEIKKTKAPKIDMATTVKIIFIFAPNTMLFYINTMSSKLLVSNMTTDPMLQSIVPILITLLSALSCLIAGHWVDTKKDATLILTKTYMAVFVLAVPVFYLQTLGSWSALILSELLILIPFGVSMAITFAEMFNKIRNFEKIIILGFGVNIGDIIFGGTTPIMVNFLTQYSHAYVGLLVSFGCLFYFVSLAIDKYQVNKTSAVMASA